MKKQAMLLIVALLAASLSGCGGSGSSSTASPAAPADSAEESSQAGSASAAKDPVKLRFMWWGGDARHEATLKVVDDFMAANPHVTH